MLPNIGDAVYLIIILSVTAPVTRSSDRNNRTSPVTFSEAATLCHHKGQRLPIFRSPGGYPQLLESLHSQRHHSFWLGINKKDLGAWTWVDETKYDYEELELDGHHECGFLDYSASHLRKTECSSLKLGYICQLKNFSSCLNLRVGHRQIHAGEECFQIHMERVNWYEARWHCLERGQDLAVLQVKAHEEELSQKIRENFDIFEMWQFWVGFRKADWMYTDPKYMNESITGAPVFWDWGEPRHMGDCAVAHGSGGSFYWKTTSCHSRHRYLCQKEKIIESDSEATDLEASYSLQESSASALNTSIGMLMSLSLLWLHRAS